MNSFNISDIRSGDVVYLSQERDNWDPRDGRFRPRVLGVALEADKFGLNVYWENGTETAQLAGSVRCWWRASVVPPNHPLHINRLPD